MLPDRVLNPGPLTYESGALPIALRGPARTEVAHIYTCQGRNNLNTLMYFNSLTLYNHILFSNNYGYILLIFS